VERSGRSRIRGATLVAAVLGLALGAWMMRPTPPPMEAPAAPTPPGAAVHGQPSVVVPALRARTLRAVSEAAEATPEPPDEGVPEPGPEVADLPEGPIGLLRGRIVDTRGRPVQVAWVMGEESCPLHFRTSGSDFEFLTEVFGCEMIAVRMDGALPTRSDPVWVEVVDDGVTDVEFVLPAERTGGIGVVIQTHEYGVQVAEVVPFTPAWEAGLEPGDVIVEVDGTPAGLLSLEDFQAVMTGPEGTKVDFVVEYEADTGFVEEEVTATRAFLDPPRRW